MLKTRDAREDFPSGGARDDTFGASSDTRSPEQVRQLFGSLLWDHVSSLRLLIQTLNKLPEVQTINAQEIRNCEVGVRSLLEEERYCSQDDITDDITDDINRNRARLKVFDQRVGEGIGVPRNLDLVLLDYTLNIWQGRLLEEYRHLAERQNPRVNLSDESAEIIFQSWQEHYMSL